MIERVRIQGFQTHRKIAVDLSHPVTAIVGPTDVGKSSILRAIRWVVTNRPGGDAFIGWDDEKASVWLDTTDGTVARLRTKKGDNRYALDKEQYKSFSTGVPEPIELFLNISEVSFQGQHDAPFWFSLSPGEVSKQLNSIINLDIIDKALAKLNTDVRKCRARATDTQERINRISTELKNLPNINAIQHDLDELVEFKTAENANRAEVTALRNSIKYVQRYQHTKERAADANVAGRKVVKLGERLQKGRRATQSLKKLINDIKATKKTVEVSSLDISEISEYYSEIETARSQADALEKLIQQIKATKAQVSDTKRRLKASKNKFTEELGEVCLTCGKSLLNKNS